MNRSVIPLYWEGGLVLSKYDVILYLHQLRAIKKTDWQTLAYLAQN